MKLSGFGKAFFTIVMAVCLFATASAPTSGTSCSSVLDNCNEPTDTFATGLIAGTVVAPSGPILSPPPDGGSHHHIWRTHQVEGDF